MNILNTMKQALEWMPPAHPATDNLRAAIEQIEKAEPVGVAESNRRVAWRRGFSPVGGLRLYAFPPEFAAPQENTEESPRHMDAPAGAAPDVVKRLRDCENYEDAWQMRQDAADLIERQQAEIERLTKERDAYCEKWHKELALGDKLRQQLAEREGWQLVGHMDGRSRFFYKDDPLMKKDHAGMREVFAAAPKPGD